MSVVKECSLSPVLLLRSVLIRAALDGLGDPLDPPEPGVPRRPRRRQPRQRASELRLIHAVPPALNSSASRN
jgi:hypothetical protein